MKRLSAILATLAILATFVPLVPIQSAAAADCQFVLGFATLHDLIPEVTGACVTNVQFNPVNGDGLQQTVNGLMVWRKADNFTAFTDGYRSWVNGPYGVQMRLNTERFTWESDKPSSEQTVPAPTPTPAPAGKSDREAMAQFANKAWPIWLELVLVDSALGQALDDAQDVNTAVGAIDRAVKIVEPLVAEAAALSAPDVPYASAMALQLKKGVSDYYEGLKQINWGIVSRDANILNAAVNQLQTAYAALQQSFWEFKAGIEKQGLVYKDGKWQ